jgi:hypothetical protein
MTYMKQISSMVIEKDSITVSYKYLGIYKIMLLFLNHNVQTFYESS